MEATLKAEVRDGTGKGVARKLRAQGRVPGVLYGSGVEPTPIHMSAQDLLHLFHQQASLVDLEVAGKTHLVIPRDVQRDHLHGRYVHVDFFAVSRTEKVTLTVEIRETGEAPGVKTGGVIEHHLRDVDILCMPGDVPDGIEADLSSLELGDMLRVGDLIVPEGVEMLSDPETPVISVVTPAALRTEVDLSVPGEEGEEPAEGAAPVAEAAAPEASAEEGGEG
jgi:large subunit ribosomal protein L25